MYVKINIFCNVQYIIKIQTNYKIPLAVKIPIHTVYIVYATMNRIYHYISIVTGDIGLSRPSLFREMLSVAIDITVSICEDYRLYDLGLSTKKICTWDDNTRRMCKILGWLFLYFKLNY